MQIAYFLATTMIMSFELHSYMYFFTFMNAKYGGTAVRIYAYFFSNLYVL